MRKTKNLAKFIHSFCPTRWTVRGETLDSLLNNYGLMSLWEWSLQKPDTTEMKARIHGCRILWLLFRNNCFDSS